MNPLRTFVFIVLLFLASCTSLTKRTINSVETVQKLQKQELVVSKKLDKNTAVYVDGALQALKKSNDTKLAIRLLENAQEITGVPEFSIRIDTELLRIADQTETKKLEQLEKTHRENIKTKQEIETQVADLHKKIEEDALKLAIANDKSVFQKIKDWIFEYVSIIAIIACLILLGPKIISFIWKRFFI